MDKVNIIDIKKIAFTKLRKLEVYRFYNEIVNVVNLHYTNEMHIDSTYDVLIGLQPKTKLLLDETFGPHALTPTINELREKRFNLAAVITNQIRDIEKISFSDKQHLVQLAKPLIIKHLNYLRQNDQTTVLQLVNVFFVEIEGNPEIKNALYELGFKSYLDELKSINNAWEQAHNERVSDWSKRPKGSTLAIQRELQKIMSMLFEKVDYYQHIYKDVDYSKLITALNNVIATYTKQIKTRETKSKNKKLKAKEAELAKLKQEADAKVIDKKQAETDINAFETTDLKNVPKGDHNLKKPDKDKENDDSEDK